MSYNREHLLDKMGLEHIDSMLFKRTSMFVFKNFYTMSPRNLAGKLLNKSCINDRTPERLTMFEISKT